MPPSAAAASPRHRRARLPGGCLLYTSITLDDLDAALTDAGLTDLDLPVWRVITRRDVLLASLRLAPDDPGRFRQDWEAREHPQPENPIFARFSPSTAPVGGERCV